MAPTVGSLTETGSSASASVEESMSEKNNVEEFGCFSAEKKNDSEIRRKLKGKGIMIHESPRNHSKTASKIKNVAEDRREVQKRAIAKKFEEIFKKKPGMTNPKKVVKKKKVIPSVPLRRSGRLSNTSATSSGPPRSEPIDIDVMKIVKKKRHVDKDAAKISMDLNDPVVGEVDKKNEECTEEKVKHNEGIQVSDNAGEGTVNKLDVSENMEKKDEEVLDVAKNSIDITDITKLADITANEPQEPINEDNEDTIIQNQETFVFPTFNLNINQDQPTPRLNDDGDDVVILKSIPAQTEKASIEVKKELYEAWKLGRGLVG